MRALTDRDRQALVRGGAALVVLMLVARGIPVWNTWRSDRALRMQRAVVEAAQSAQFVRYARPLRDSLAARNARYLALAPMLVSGSSAVEAAATLTSMVSDAATQAGAKIGAIQVRSPLRLRQAADSTRPSLIRVGVQADITGDVAELMRILTVLERGPMSLAIRSFAVSQSEAAAPANHAEALQVELMVEGVALDNPAHRAAGER